MTKETFTLLKRIYDFLQQMLCSPFLTPLMGAIDPFHGNSGQRLAGVPFMMVFIRSATAN